MAELRGYFGIGAEGMSKPGNLGNLVRSAHAFGASFVFTVNAKLQKRDLQTDTSAAPDHLPVYRFQGADSLRLPDGCQLVGIELTGDAIDLPSFQHPKQAAYILGPERGELSAPVMAACDHVVKIPTKFCINVGMAGAIVMYDRLRTLGRFPPRSVMPGAPVEGLDPHHFGGYEYRPENNDDKSDEKG